MAWKNLLFLTLLFNLHIICSVCSLFCCFQKEKGTLHEQLSAIKPVLEDLRMKKQERMKEFSETQSQIVWICAEIAGNIQSINSVNAQVNERDLTMKKLGGLKSYLQELQSEKVFFKNLIQDQS